MKMEFDLVPPKFRKKTKTISNGAIVVIAALLILAVVGVVFGIVAVFQLGNPQEYTVTHIIIQTELQSSTNGDGGVSVVKTKYLYFCELQNGETVVFQNEDSLFNGKFDSSTLLAKLRKYEQSGETFTIKTSGWRIPFLTMYQNIVEVS